MSFEAFSFDDDPPSRGRLSAAEVPPSGTPSSTDTSSWAYVTSRVTGGASGVGRDVLEIDGDPAAAWCCGAVAVRSGGSMKFCTLPAGKCTVAAHQSGRTKGAKHAVVGDALYIPTSDKTALVSPFLENPFYHRMNWSRYR
jgi:hypothetical protein